ncbi:hypothetical protein C8F04DRAFT_1274216 [Mycena alexandri]|uniref:Uncharacterized protein n=1 Tax=Mycena alexandri TaxID=1745969 RepID=A0AAD6S4H7_9AGAR|nr:hypothetical protein C8F04DRAFT_1274216 [Mycena alexandri]
MPPKVRCQPRFFPQPGHEDTFVHDGRKDGRYFVVGAGHCGNGVFTDPKVADKETDGFSGYEKRSAKRWTGVGGVEEIWASFCDRLHSGGCHHGERLPVGWAAPTPVIRNCPAPTPAAAGPAPAPAAAAPAPLNGGERLVALPLVLPAPTLSTSMSAPGTPKRTGGSGNTWASPLVVRSSVSPSPLRPPPQYHPMAPNASGSPRPRTALNPNGTAALMSGASSILSSISTSSSASSSSQASATASTPKKQAQARVQSSPNGGYDTDYYYDDDSDDDAPQATQQRLWAVRGLEGLFSDVDAAFDALRQNMDRLRYMEVRSSTSPTVLRRFAAS